MTLQSVLAALATLVAVLALLRGRRLARRLEQVVESYWELRYDYGQLRAQVDRLRGKSEPEAEPSASTTFVPLSRLRSPETKETSDGETPQNADGAAAVSIRRT